MSNDEKDDYLQRMLDKNINTYYKLLSLCKGFNVTTEKSLLIFNKKYNFAKV